jgi:putative heme iron utilization protein
MSEPIRPSHAALGRALLARCRTAILTTLDRETGHPYGSVTEIMPTADGGAWLLLSGLAEHTRNLKQDPRCGLVTADGMHHAEPLIEARISVLGAAAVAIPSDDERAAWLERFPGSAQYIGFADFAFWRLAPERVRYIAGFGRMSWVDGPTWQSTDPDPLWEGAPGIISHMNEDHRNNLIEYVRAFGDFEACTDATMLTVDSLGFDVRASNEHERRFVRIAFDEPATNSRLVRRAMVQLAAQARAALTTDAGESTP